MKIVTSSSTETDTNAALSSAWAKVAEESTNAPSLVLVYYSDTHDQSVIASTLAGLSGCESIHGSSSCLGLMTQQGFHSEGGVGLGIWALHDNEGAYGVGAAEIGDDPTEAGIIAVEQALENANRIGEVPELVWVHSSPGVEEAIIEGIAKVVGEDVPVAGGSAGDNTVTGNWSLVAGRQHFTNAVTVSVFFPSKPLSFSFHSGYEPSEPLGVVTKTEGRVLVAIDDTPAAEVYNRATGGIISDALEEGGNVLSLTTLAPIGREVGKLGIIPYYKLSHPDAVTPDGGLSLFSNINVGDELILMKGSKKSLIERAGKVATVARKMGDSSVSEVAGALVIYCAGCMLTVQDSMGTVSAGIETALGGAPFVGVFTFGEQGCFVGGENQHGNLMISIVTFSN